MTLENAKKLTNKQLYLSWLNDFITIEKFASYYDLTRDEAYDTIQLGREDHRISVANNKFQQSIKD